MATLTVYPDANPETSTVDGIVSQGDYLNTYSWAQIIAAAGDGSDDTSINTYAIEFFADSVTDKWYFLFRSIFLFDTSSLTAQATISSAVLSLFGQTKTDQLSVTPDIDIYTSNPASNTSLTGTDFSTLGSTSQTGSPISYASFSTSAYNDFPLNTTGISNISKTGISKFGARNANYDVSGTPPTWSALKYSALYIYYADQTGTTNDPKLVITYTTYPNCKLYHDYTKGTAQDYSGNNNHGTLQGSASFVSDIRTYFSHR